MLIIEDLQTDIGSINILRGVNIDVPDGSMTGLIGRNGAGKTTLLRTIMGVLPAKQGKIILGDEDITHTMSHLRARMGIGYMPEDRRLVPDFTVEDNIMVPAWATEIDDPQKRLEWIYSIMPEVEERRTDWVNQLSGGQQKLVALARSIMAARKLLILDEPFEGLAPVLARRLAEVMFSLKEDGMSVLIADSNDQHLAGLLDASYLIERGSVSLADS